MTTVKDMLGRRKGIIYSLHPLETVFDALKTLAAHDVGALLVIDEEGQLVGVFSERDYTRKIVLLGKNSRDTRVDEIMTANPKTVSPGVSTVECMHLMSKHKFRHLPVMEGEKVMGMISMRDIMDSIIHDQEQIIGQLQSYIAS